MGTPLDFMRKRLSAKILLTLTVGVAIVMGAVIYLNVNSQRAQLKERMMTSGRELRFLAYAGIKHPMSVGDSASVERQLMDVKETLKSAEIVICDFNRTIVFATHEERIGADVSQFVHNREALNALRNLLETGMPYYDRYFEEEFEGKKYLITLHRIANEAECYHCHGDSRKVLGSLIVRQSTDETYAAIASLRNYTLLISALGIGGVVALIYFMLARLVTWPVTDMAEKASRFARGDMSVSVDVKSGDAIGALGASFNNMVKNIKDQIEYADSLKVAISDPFFIVNPDMVITYMNRACEEITGFRREEAEGKMTCREVFKSDICDTTCPLKQSFTAGKAVEGVRVTMTNREGGAIPMMASASPLRDSSGKLLGGFEICRDISAVLDAERLKYAAETAAREEAQRRYLEERGERLLATLTLAAESRLDARAEIRGTNDVMDKLAGHVNSMLDNIARLYEKVSLFNKELKREVARRTIQLKEKTIELERANRDLKELDRLKTAFLANMSHELRTPMNSIIGYTELLLDGVDGPVNPEQAKSLEKVGSNARHLLELINDVLDMSKIEAGKVDLVLREIDLKKSIASVAATFEPLVESKHLTLTLDIENSLPPVYADEDKVRQILVNLLNNAIKFTDQGGITISAAPYKWGTRQAGGPDFIRVCVEDTGIGIKDEDIGRLFEKFSQLDSAISRQYEGTGLGLSITRALVVLHKGDIWVESAYGKGSRFFFTLPVKKHLIEESKQVVLDPEMASALAEHTGKPVETFLKEPSSAGRPVRCWEYFHCGQTTCPAFGSTEPRCWLMRGTHCKGAKRASYPEKVDFCKDCDVIRMMVSEAESPEDAEQAKTPAAEKKTVIAIDDNPDVIELIKKYIGADYNVVGLSSGEHAVEKARELRPVAITLDIMMPVRDGWQVLQDLKKTPDIQDIPVIILSIVDNKKLGFSMGAAEYIVKPVDKHLLLRRLKHLEKIAAITRVLVVDSDTHAAEVVSRMLAEAGYQAFTAGDNKSAIEAMKHARPDLIVLNLIMPASGEPDGNGPDIIEYIKSAEGAKDIPLIVITRKDPTEDELKNLNGRIQAILNKGMLAEEDLLTELKSTICKWRRTSEG
ncbi:MAG: response regulator [Nitrospirota bacterium]